MPRSQILIYQERGDTALFRGVMDTFMAVFILVRIFGGLPASLQWWGVLYEAATSTSQHQPSPPMVNVAYLVRHFLSRRHRSISADPAHTRKYKYISINVFFSHA